MKNSISFELSIKTTVYLLISIAICGCATRYSITVVDDDRKPVSFANYGWHLDRWGRAGLGGEGQTDINGCAVVESHPGTYFFVLKDDLWGEAKFKKNQSSYVVSTVSTNEQPMHFFARYILGVDKNKNTTSNHH